MAKRAENDAYQLADAAAREVRGVVGEQLAQLMHDAAGMGSRGEFAMRLAGIVREERKIAESLGRQQQAREMGLRVAQFVAEEREAREGLRQAVMELARACGCWAAAMDFEARRASLAAMNGHNANGGEDGD